MAVILGLEILHLFGVPIAYPGLPLLAAIISTAFLAGMRAGLTATCIGILYELVVFSGFPNVAYTLGNAVRIAMFSVSGVLASVLVEILRKRVEAATWALAHREAAVAWQAEWVSLESVLHQLPLGVVVADTGSGEITFANDKARSLLGDNIDRIHSVGFPTMHHVDSGRSYSPDEWPLRRCAAQRMAIDEDFLYARESGQIAVLHGRACPIYDRSGRVIAAVMSLSDLPEKKSVERQLAAVALQAASLDTGDSPAHRARPFRCA